MFIEILLLIEYIGIIFFLRFFDKYDNKFLISLIYFSQPLSLLLFWPYKIDPFRIIPFLFLGLILIYFVLKEKNEKTNFKLDNLGTLHSILSHKFIPLIGSFLFLSIIYYEIKSVKMYFGFFSTISLVLSLFIIYYRQISEKYVPEVQISILFCTFFLLLFMIPTLILFLKTGNFSVESEPNFGDYFIHVFLGLPVSNALNLLGYVTFSNGNILSYQDYTVNITQQVSIAQSCTGFFSLIMFISIYSSYIIVHYGKFDAGVLVLLFLGILISYISNLLRMIIIVLIGIHYGTENLVWAHTNLGWIIFTTWLFIFWFFLNNYMDLNLDKNSDGKI